MVPSLRKGVKKQSDKGGIRANKKKSKEPLESKDDERTRGEEKGYCNQSNKVRERLEIDTRSFFLEVSENPEWQERTTSFPL